MRWLAAVAAAGATVLVALNWDDVRDACSSVPPWAFVSAVALHTATLAVRSEAWRVVLSAIAGAPPPRVALHGANAGAFLVGVAQSHAALPARVALLARLQPGGVRPVCVALADVPIVAIELAWVCVLVAPMGVALHAPWVALTALALGVAVLVAARLLHARFAHRPVVAGLAVLSDARLRVALVALLGLVTALTVARIWMLLSVTGLPASYPSVALVLVSVAAFGLLPLGPSASPAGTVATLGASGMAAALVLGLAVSATSICAVVVYAATVWSVILVARATPAEARATPAEAAL